MLIYNSIMIFLIATLSVCSYQIYKQDFQSSSMQAKVINTAFYSSIILVNALVLARSVLVIRKTLQSLHNAFPNEKLIKIHVVNSCVTSITFFLSTFLLMLEAKERQNDKIKFFNQLAYVIALAFQLYMDMFLLYVIQRFTRLGVRKNEKDKVLGR